MTESKSTDKLITLSSIIDKTIDKLPEDKVSKIKTLKIEWVDLSQGSYQADSPLPIVNLEFYE